MPVLYQSTLDHIRRRREAEREATTWTDTKTVYVGNGKIPAVVVIPLAERDAPWLSIYCIDSLVDPKQIYQVFNNFAGLTFDNSTAGIKVQIGKPPGKSYYQFTPDQPEELALSTGGSGALPSQIVQKQQALITHDRIYELKLYPPTTGLVLNLTTGYFRIGNEWQIWEDGAFWDATDYVPASATTAVYVLVAIDIDNSPQITIGTEFTVGAESIITAAPRTIPNASMQLAVVYLYNGMTAFTTDDIVNIQDVPTGIDETSVLAAASDVFISSDTTIFVSSDGTSFVSAGA